MTNHAEKLRPLILYHAECDDGFGAAYSAWRQLGNDAEFRPAYHGSPAPADADLIGRDVFILDFSFAPETVLSMARVAKSLTLLDHHKSAMDQWGTRLQAEGNVQSLAEGNLRISFDMTRSGAQMAWDHFHPRAARSKLIDYIGDKDLWQFNLAETKAFCAGLQLIPTTFEAWHAASSHRNATIEQGRAVLGYQQQLVDKAANGELRNVTLCGRQGLAANVTNNHSEVGNVIALKSGTFSLTFMIKGDQVVCSLRSIAPFDVGAIAQQFGGGGHPQAAGFVMPIGRFFAEVWKVSN